MIRLNNYIPLLPVYNKMALFILAKLNIEIHELSEITLEEHQTLKDISYIKYDHDMLYN